MSNTTAMQGMLYRMLGSTGEKVSAIGIGGWHIGLNGVDEQLSSRIIRTAVERGINFMIRRYRPEPGVVGRGAATPAAAEAELSLERNKRVRNFKLKFKKW